MNKIITRFNKLPSNVQVILYSGVSVFLATILVMISGEVEFDWRKLAVIPITVMINLLAYIINTKKSK